MIRLYTYAGFVEIDRQQFLKEPYLGRAVVAPGEVSKPEAAPDQTRLAYIVADEPCTYEVTPCGHPPRIADKDSPRLEEDDTIAFGPGWALSVWAPSCEVKPKPTLADRMTEVADAPG